MHHTKSEKLPVKATRTTSASKAKIKEEAMETLIHGLDALILHAENSELGTAVRVLFSAKEELVHWAITLNFHESAQDVFINQHLYNNRLSSVESLVIRAIKDSGMCNEMLQKLGLTEPQSSGLGSRK